MSAESDTYAAVAQDPAVIALVGGRIKPDFLPEKMSLPAITYMRVGGERHYNLDSSVHAERVRMRFVAWAVTRTAANEIGEAVAAALNAAGYAPAPPDSDFDEETYELAAIVETDWWN